MSGISNAALHEQRRKQVYALIERVEKLEEWATRSSPGMAAVGGVIGRGFWGRLRWLLFGR